MQIIFYDQRGHGRSDHSRAEFWNLPTWADDLRRLCDALGLIKPVVLGSSFGGFVVLTYAAIFPDHPGGVILTNTTGGRIDHPASVEIFRRLGGDEAAAVAARDFAEMTEQSADEFNRVCHPLYSSKPGSVEESRLGLARSIHTTEVNLHYFRNEAPRFDPWSLLADVRCPVLILAGEDDPICPISVVEDLARQLPAPTTRLVRLPQATAAAPSTRAWCPTSRSRRSGKSCTMSAGARHRDTSRGLPRLSGAVGAVAGQLEPEPGDVVLVVVVLAVLADAALSLESGAGAFGARPRAGPRWPAFGTDSHGAAVPLSPNGLSGAA